MIREELEKFKSICKQGIDLVDYLLNQSYNLEHIELDEKIKDIIKYETFEVELEKLEEEKNNQFFILYDAKNWIRYNNPECNFQESATKIRAYDKYYFIQMFGTPFGKVDIVYSRSGSAFHFVEKKKGHIDVIDGNNYFYVTKDGNAWHKKVDSTGNCCYNVRILNDVHSCVLPVFGARLDVEFGDLVGWINGQEKGVLYNYTIANIMVPEYTDVSFDLGRLEFMLDLEKYIRVIHTITYENLESNLEFAIDRGGILRTDVYDFDRNINYFRNKDGEDQAQRLETIYKEAMTRLSLEFEEKNKAKKMVKRKG